MNNEEKLLELHNNVHFCTKCNLWQNRIQPILGEGDINADIMFIGESPGQDEDIQGRPFVGAAGKMLDLFLEEAGINRQSVYITNLVKCRPPGNRVPTYEEKAACRKHLDAELEEVNPKKILILGLTALSAFLGPNKYHQHAVPYEYEGKTIWPLYHPAYAIYSRDRLPQMLEEYKKALKS